MSFFWLKNILLSALAGSISTGALADEGSRHLLGFRSGLYAAVQPSGTYTVGPGLSWTPSYHTATPFDVRGDVGVLLLKNSHGRNFSAVDYGVGGSYKTSDALSLELGVGGQYWADPNGAAHGPTVTSKVVRELQNDLITAWFGGVTVVFMPSVTTFLLGSGVGF